MKVSEVKLTYKTKVKASERSKISDADSAYKILEPFYEDFMDHKEVSFVMLLNRANQVLGISKLSEGGVAGTVIDLKILFQFAILSNSSGIILSHNHPSGKLSPSEADLYITKKTKEAGKLLDIELLDHLILTSEGYYSFADEGKI